jgi:hypothetical protein
MSADGLIGVEGWGWLGMPLAFVVSAAAVSGVAPRAAVGVSHAGASLVQRRRLKAMAASRT